MSKQKTNYVLNLAIARELLLIDRAKYLPADGRAQNKSYLQTINRAIADGILATKGDLGAAPPASDKTATRAYAFLKKKSLSEPSYRKVHVSAYDNLCKIFERINFLDEAEGIITWLQQTNILGDTAKPAIANSTAALKVAMIITLQNQQISDWFTEAHSEVATSDNAREVKQRNLKLMEYSYKRTTALDTDFTRRYSKACSRCENMWMKARKKNDFAVVLPSLKALVSFEREKSKRLAKALSARPYQTTLNNHNEELGLETVNEKITELKARLPELVIDAEKKAREDSPPLPLPSLQDNAALLRIAQRLTTALGLKSSFFRLDQVEHGYSGGKWDDIRIAIRKTARDLISATVTMMHEDGHALFDHNLPKEFQGQLIGRRPSMWVHETQSLFWEQVLRSPEFMEFLAPIYKEELHVDGPEWEPANLFKQIIHYRPGLIRIDGDDITYMRHLIIRKELEEKLINGDLEAEDLPAAWNKAMKDTFDIDVPDFVNGCGQDIHWFAGIYGDFPGYIFGKTGAAQLVEKAKRDIPKFNELVRAGEFKPIVEWLTKNIHRHGGLYEGLDLIKKATGKELSVEPYINEQRKNLHEQRATRQWAGDGVTKRTGMRRYKAN